MKNAPSASIVYTGPSGGNGTGQGAAAILDQHPDGLGYVQDLYAQRAKQKLIAAQQKREKEKDWTKLTRDMPDVWDVDSEAIRGDLNTYSDELIKLKMSGADPLDIYSPAGKRAKEVEANLEKRTNLAKGNQEYFQTAKLAIDKDTSGKYDKAYAAEWFKKFTDPKLTPEERADLRYNSSPFKVDISDEELVTDTVPERTELEYEAFVDPKAHKEILINKFIQDPELFESKKREGETIEQTAQRLTDLGQKMFPRERKRRPVGGSGGSGSGGGENKSKLLISGSKDSTEGLDQSDSTSWNRVSVKRAGTNDDLPAIRVFSDNPDPKNPNSKEVIEFQPSEFVMGKNGKIGVRGVKVTTSPAAFGSPTVVKEDTWVDYDTNKDAFESQLEDRSMYDIMREKREAQGSTSTQQAKPQMTEQEWSAAWAKLKPGEKMMGLDGKEYTKK